MFGFRAHLDDGGIADNPAQAQAAVQAAYKLDRPFFTRDAFRSVAESFNKALQEGSGGTEVAIRGVDGAVVNFRLQTGKVEYDCEAPHVPSGSPVVV